MDQYEFAIIFSPSYQTVTSNANVYVTLGKHGPGSGVSKRVNLVIKHENYDSESTTNDIALLRLAEPVSCRGAVG